MLHTLDRPLHLRSGWESTAACPLLFCTGIRLMLKQSIGVPLTFVSALAHRDGTAAISLRHWIADARCGTGSVRRLSNARGMLQPSGVPDVTTGAREKVRLSIEVREVVSTHKRCRSYALLTP